MKSVSNLAKLFLLIVAILLSGHMSALAQDPQDPGQPDTIWVECGNKAVHDTGGWVAFTIYLKTDNQVAGSDIVAFDIPLFLSRTNPADSGRLDTTVSQVFAKSVYDTMSLVRSVYADSLYLNGFLDLGTLKFPGPMNGTYILAQLWVRLTDSSSISVDTMSRGTNSLQLVTSNAVGYVPIWKKATCLVCVHSSPAGDADCSGNISLADVIYLINYLFKQWSPPCCYSLGDNNCSGTITLGDAILLVNYIFNKGGPVPQYCP